MRSILVVYFLLSVLSPAEVSAATVAVRCDLRLTYQGNSDTWTVDSSGYASSAVINPPSLIEGAPADLGGPHTPSFDRMIFCTTINVGTDDVINVTTKRLRALEGAACSVIPESNVISTYKDSFWPTGTASFPYRRYRASGSAENFWRVHYFGPTAEFPNQTPAEAEAKCRAVASQFRSL